MNDQELLEACEDFYEKSSQDLEKAQEKLEELYNLIEQQVSPETMNLINEYSNLQIEVEKECNQ